MLFLIGVALCFISLFIGVKNITLKEILLGNTQSLQIFIVSRIPRLISILVAGVGLSICGLIMQRISQNKFVSPTTGATLDSAQLGMLLYIILFPNA